MRVTLATWQLFAAVALLLFVVVPGLSFVVDVGSERLEPVSFDRTVKRGITMADEQVAASRGVSLPRVEVFYSQYRYVVGYIGIGQAATELTEPGHERQFGYPLAVYVSDYSGSSVRCTSTGYLESERRPGWVAAADAHFVVDSRARTPSGPAVVPFGDRVDAVAFAGSCDGTIVDWTAIRDRSFDIDRAASVRGQVQPRRERAETAVGDARNRHDRPVSVVVGRDATTIQAAVDAAPPNTTVRVPPGTYHEQVHVNKSITLHGEGARLNGSTNGTALTVRADRVGIVGFDVTGVGTRTVGNRSSVNESGWDSTVTAAYGNSDAAVTARNASGLYLADLSVETPASGIVLRRMPGAVVENVTVNGTEDWQDGFMGVIAMHADVVIQNSTFWGGRDGVYLHRADGTVVSGNTFRTNRFGVHLMYTSGTLVADNVARGQQYAGIVVMTDPEANAIVGNDIRDAGSGIMTAGSRSYVADNVVANTSRGLSANAGRSLYEDNVVYGNDVGITAATVVPSNVVTGNDFVANDRHATTGPGPLRVYTADGRGNYWSGAYDTTMTDTSTLDRPYAPTNTVDSRLHRTDAAVVLGSAPGLRGLRALRGTTPGFRRGSIVDTAPLSSPNNPETVSALRNETVQEGRP
ncbi:MAG: NosD domain-containing protein [Haloarcula sp.]